MFYLREGSLAQEDDVPSQDWYSWALSETGIRIKLTAFCFLNLHTIAYNHPPALFWHEVNLRLPCTVKEWDASNSVQWLFATQDAPIEQRRFPDALRALLSPDEPASKTQPAPSPYGNLVLLHGLLQRIYLIRQLATTPAIEEDEIAKLQ